GYFSAGQQFLEDSAGAGDGTRDCRGRTRRGTQYSILAWRGTGTDGRTFRASGGGAGEGWGIDPRGCAGYGFARFGARAGGGGMAREGMRTGSIGRGTACRTCGSRPRGAGGGADTNDGDCRAIFR